MAVERSEDCFPTMNDEEWLVYRAKQCIKTDPFAAKSWLLTARTFFPKNFKIQYEAYLIEKNAKQVKDVAKILEDMFRNFPSEPQLWQEVWSYSEALQSEATDEQTMFQKSVFAALPASLQYHMLVNVAETTQDVLQQCRLMLLVLHKYPDQVPDQGVKLIDSLLSTEKHHQPSSPVNCYRKYLVCHVIPQVLKTCKQSSPKHLYRWLQKAVEFYMCYLTHNPAGDTVTVTSPDLQSPTTPRPFPPTPRKVVISGLTEKEAHIDDPWTQLFDLVHAIGAQLDWDMAGLMDNSSCGAQWQSLETLWEATQQQTTDTTAPVKQVLYCAAVLMLHSLYKYGSHVDPCQFTVPLGGAPSTSPVVLIEALKSDCSVSPEHKPKKQKREASLPMVTTSAAISGSAELTDTFLAALHCWELLHSTDGLAKDFSKLLQHWKSDSWTWFRDFEIDVLIYQGNFKEAISKLQSAKPAPGLNTVRADIQIACCNYCLGNYAQACDRVLRVVSSLPLGTPDQPTVSPPEVTERGRHLQLLMCRETEILPYCIHLLITCYKDKAFGTAMPDDMSLGHMLILMQYNWPKYEQLFCDILRKIRHQGNFMYSLFFNYVINIDILEEFAYLKTEDGGRIALDILPTSTKQLTQTRTVTRGVNKGVKEDFKAAMEKQVSRSDEHVEVVIRQFFADEREILQQQLV